MVMDKPDEPLALTDLIARLEAAPQGSRELSDKVLLACGWRLVPDPGGFLPWPKWLDPDGNYVCDNVTDGHEKKRPSPTECLDAAMALVPEEWRTVQAGEMDEDIDGRNGWYWELGVGPDDEGNPNYENAIGIAATPALALSAAALKAQGYE